MLNLLPLIIYAAYLFFLLIFVVLVVAIFYHLLSYSIDPQMRLVSLIFFTVVSIILFFSNLIIFFATDWSVFLNNLA